MTALCIILNVARQCAAHPLHDPPIRRCCLSLVRCSLYSDVNSAFGKLDWIFVCGQTTVEAMLRRILQMVSSWSNEVNRIAFVWLKRAVFLGRRRPILVCFHGGGAPFLAQCVAGGRGFRCSPAGVHRLGNATRRSVSSRWTYQALLVWGRHG